MEGLFIFKNDKKNDKEILNTKRIQQILNTKRIEEGQILSFYLKDNLLIYAIENKIKLFDLEKNKIKETVEISDSINQIDGFADNDSLYFALILKSKTLSLYKMHENKIENILNKVIHKKEINTVKMAKMNDKLCIFTGSNDKSILMHSINGILMHQLNFKKSIWAIETMKNKVIFSEGEKIHVLENLKIIQTIELHKSIILKIKKIDKMSFVSADSDGIIKTFVFDKNKNLFKLNFSKKVSNERIWSLFNLCEKIEKENIFGFGDANGLISILVSQENKLKEIKKQKEIEIKEMDFNLKRLKKEKKVDEICKILFDNSENYAIIEFLSLNLCSIKENNQIKINIEKVLKTNQIKTKELIEFCSTNFKFVEIFVFLLENSDLKNYYQKPIKKYFEKLEDLKIDIAECEYVLKDK